ncbi:hypothetical protein ACHAWC_003493 [Mediolabrus comicus]
MKFTAALLITNVAGASAFAPPRRHSSIKQQRSQQQSPTAVHLVGDSSILQADIVEGLVSTVGSLALLGSVGFGILAGYKDDEWDYEYKPGNEEASKKYGAGADLALIEVSPEEVAEDIVKAEETAAAPADNTAAQKSFFGKVKEAATPKKAAVTAKPAEAKPTSDTVLKATEVAKSQVQKVGVQETKEKMSSKTASAAASAPAEPEEEPAKKSDAVTETKKEEKGTKRKLAKGVTLIVAAGAVAVARNLVKAWLGRGML